MILDNIKKSTAKEYFLHNASAGQKYRLNYMADGSTSFRICLKSGKKTKVLNRAEWKLAGNATTIYTAPIDGAVYIEDVLALSTDAKNQWTALENITVTEE